MESRRKSRYTSKTKTNRSGRDNGSRGGSRGSRSPRDRDEGSRRSNSRGSRERSRPQSRGSEKGSQRSRKSSKSPEVPVEDVRKHILQHYGISAEEEKARKEKKAEKFRNYVQNSGLQLAFQLVISEIISKGIPKNDVFKYGSKRFREIGREYAEIVRNENLSIFSLFWYFGWRLRSSGVEMCLILISEMTTLEKCVDLFAWSWSY